jgi:hypothetical protein
MVSVRRLFRGKALPLVYGATIRINYLQGLEMTGVTIFFLPGRSRWRERPERVNTRAGPEISREISFSWGPRY